MKTLIKWLNKRIMIKELQAKIDWYEDAVMHRGNELGEERIVKDLKDQLAIIKGEGSWWFN